MAEVAEVRRSSNIELYRIVIMLLIISHHYVVNSGVLEIINSTPLSEKTLFYYFLGMWGKVGINCFVLITGYFMCTKDIKITKFFRLLFEVWFYVIIIHLLFHISGYHSISLHDILSIISPYISLEASFTASFLYFYLLIPFLNILVQNMNQRQFLTLLSILGFLYVVLSTTPKIGCSINYTEWFCVLYLLSSYMRIYNVKSLLSKRKWGGLFLMLVVLSMISVVIMAYFFRGRFGFASYWFVADANHILAVMVSVCAFMFTVVTDLPYNRLINWVAQSVFGIFIIHTNSNIMREFLWKDLFKVTDHYYMPHYVFFSILSIICVFVVCMLIDKIRIYVFEKNFIKLFGRCVDSSRMG